MKDLYTHLYEKNPQGIPFSEAIQMFLWLFVSLSILPVELRGQVIDKELLEQTFKQLDSEGLIIDPSAMKAGNKRVGYDWQFLVRRLLSKPWSLMTHFLPEVPITYERRKRRIVDPANPRAPCSNFTHSAADGFSQLL